MCREEATDGPVVQYLMSVKEVWRSNVVQIKQRTAVNKEEGSIGGERVLGGKGRKDGGGNND